MAMPSLSTNQILYGRFSPFPVSILETFTIVGNMSEWHILSGTTKMAALRFFYRTIKPKV